VTEESAREQRPATPQLSAAKRRQILAGARETFRELGYEHASVDAIAARAGVAKATVYNHFADKSALFAACFSEGADAMRDELRAVLAAPCDDLEKALQSAGERIVAVLLSCEALAMHRNAGELIARFPEIGRMFWERGPRLTYGLIAGYLTKKAEHGALRIEDPYSAAVQFVMLCKGDLVTKAFLGVEKEPSAEEVRETVRRAVRTFLGAYRR
jgi:TetR/AcrR family transcriptional repressor of mexJK operon